MCRWGILGRGMTTDPSIEGLPARRRYSWPWFVLGAVVLAIVLAVAWMSREFERARRIRDANTPPPETNTAVPTSPSR